MEVVLSERNAIVAQLSASLLQQQEQEKNKLDGSIRVLQDVGKKLDHLISCEQSLQQEMQLLQKWFLLSRDEEDNGLPALVRLDDFIEDNGPAIWQGLAMGSTQTDQGLESISEDEEEDSSAIVPEDMVSTSHAGEVEEEESEDELPMDPHDNESRPENVDERLTQSLTPLEPAEAATQMLAPLSPF